jgi:hypothetical protein
VITHFSALRILQFFELYFRRGPFAFVCSATKAGAGKEKPRIARGFLVEDEGQRL